MTLLDVHNTKSRNKIIAALIAIAGLLLTAYALLNPSSDVHSSMMGVEVSSSYSVAEMLLAAIGMFMAGSGTAFILFKEDYEPINDAPAIHMPTTRPGEEVAESAKNTDPVANPAVIPTEPDEASPDERKLVLRLLTGDERAMFRAIVESGGEALQKDLIVRTRMSDAKVSRVLDRLMEKGVISKTRHGVTNKVRIEIEP
jgi:uncharacterized membrane protein